MVIACVWLIFLVVKKIYFKDIKYTQRGVTQHRILVTVDDMVFGHLAPKLRWLVRSVVENFPAINFPQLPVA